MLTYLDNHSNLRLYSSVLQMIAKLSSFLSENVLSAWTKNCWTSLKIKVNLTLSGLNLWSAKNDLNACLRNSSFGSPEKLNNFFLKNDKQTGINHVGNLPLLVEIKTTHNLFLTFDDTGGHNWSNISWDDNLGNWRNWCASNTSKRASRANS